MPTEAEKAAERAEALKKTSTYDTIRRRKLENEYETRYAMGEPVGEDREQYINDRMHGTR